MNKVFAALAAGLFALSAPTLAVAQATDPAAVAQATSQQACGEAAVIRAIFLDDGRLQVTCPRGSVPGNPNALSGTTLTTAQWAALAAAGAVVIWVIADDDDSVSTTTTTGTN